MIRDECILCNDHAPLRELFTLKDYPITPSSSPDGDSADEYSDCIFAGCRVCGTLQLKTLIDPVKLYQNSHNSTENTPTWKEHHRLFAEFVSADTDSRLLEVGGNSGTLYNLLKDKIPEYTILDICDSEKRPSTVKFLQGNCEQFDFSGHSHIALSHTFEHLYTPRNFIENLSRARVQSVFISIPNMEHLYNSKNISVLHNEHTFFVGDAEIQYLFSQYGYSCAKAATFKQHSLFYHFVYDTLAPILPLPISIQRTRDIKHYLSKFQASLEKVVIDRACFICPAGHYGQKIYYYLQQYQRYIMGFIDNDVSKQGLRVYGTSAYVFSPDVLRVHKDNKLCIILYAGPYSEELKKQPNELHSDILYIEL